MPGPLRHFQPFAGANWYEEDCDWCIVALAFPEFFGSDAVPAALTDDGLRRVRRQLEIFGLQAARLDLREDSGRLAAMVGRMLAALGSITDFEQGDDAQRTVFLLSLLKDDPPAAATLTAAAGAHEASDETWRLFRLLARAGRVYGEESLGPFVVSMAHGAADVLAVLLLARWAGCAPGLAVAPLFETLDDLDRAPGVMASLLALDVYRAHVAAGGGEQMVMIGYSDSNKDCGYLAANWALYRAQQSIARVCDEHSVALTLFHGRGGSVARGGGPAARAIRAQPRGTLRGRFRVTEQGETIASRYADHDLAHRHLEQIVSAVLLSSAQTATDDVLASWRSAMETMAAAARDAYLGLVERTPGFLDY